MSFEAVPHELRELPRWVVWRWGGEVDPKTGKRKKPPYCPRDLSRHAPAWAQRLGHRRVELQDEEQAA